MENYLYFSEDFLREMYLKVNKIEPDKLWGSILYLGMGNSFIPRLQSDNVIKTTILEIEDYVIEYNKKNDLLKKDWIIIKGDAYTYKTNEKFDFIFIDIFYEEIDSITMNSLIRKYKEYLNYGGKILYLKSVVRR